MKKIKRFGSILLALGMLCALAVPANASNAQLSEFAGEMVQCQVVIANADGSTSSELLEVCIPIDATQAEEDSIIQNAILGTVFEPVSRSPARALFDTIFDNNNVIIDRAYGMTNLGNGTLNTNYETLIGQFNFSSVTGTNYELDGYPYMTVRFSDGNRTASRGVEISVGTNVLAVVTSGGLNMDAGTSISVSASVDKGRLTGNFSLLASETPYDYS